MHQQRCEHRIRWHRHARPHLLVWKFAWGHLGGQQQWHCLTCSACTSLDRVFSETDNPRLRLYHDPHSLAKTHTVACNQQHAFYWHWINLVTAPISNVHEYLWDVVTIDKTDGMQTFYRLALSGIRCPYSFLRVCLALLVYNVSCEYHLGGETK